MTREGEGSRGRRRGIEKDKEGGRGEDTGGEVVRGKEERKPGQKGGGEREKEMRKAEKEV